MRIVRLAALLLLLCEPPASAQFYTGNDLYAVCIATQSEEAFNTKWGECLGYIIGIADAHIFAAPRNCPNSQVTRGQARDVVIRYLQLNPGIRHLSAETLASAALAQAFPCQ
jgi:hypothetical protein